MNYCTQFFRGFILFRNDARLCFAYDSFKSRLQKAGGSASWASFVKTTSRKPNDVKLDESTLNALFQADDDGCSVSDEAAQQFLAQLARSHSLDWFDLGRSRGSIIGRRMGTQCDVIMLYGRDYPLSLRDRQLFSLLRSELNQRGLFGSWVSSWGDFVRNGRPSDGERPFEFALDSDMDSMAAPYLIGVPTYE
jgi:hypothetical protein